MVLTMVDHPKERACTGLYAHLLRQASSGWTAGTKNQRLKSRSEAVSALRMLLCHTLKALAERLSPALTHQAVCDQLELEVLINENSLI